MHTKKFKLILNQGKLFFVPETSYFYLDLGMSRIYQTLILGMRKCKCIYNVYQSHTLETCKNATDHSLRGNHLARLATWNWLCALFCTFDNVRLWLVQINRAEAKYLCPHNTTGAQPHAVPTINRQHFITCRTYIHIYILNVEKVHSLHIILGIIGVYAIPFNIRACAIWGRSYEARRTNRSDTYGHSAEPASAPKHKTKRFVYIWFLIYTYSAQADKHTYIGKVYFFNVVASNCIYSSFTAKGDCHRVATIYWP